MRFQQPNEPRMDLALSGYRLRFVVMGNAQKVRAVRASYYK
jgi:hypothetical protein